MNRTIFREAAKCGFKINNNLIIYNSSEIDINKFLFEITRLQFTHSLEESLEIFKTNFLLNQIDIGEKVV